LPPVPSVVLPRLLFTVAGLLTVYPHEVFNSFAWLLAEATTVVARRASVCSHETDGQTCGRQLSPRTVPAVR
jgi:hypothetical protein